MSRALPWCLLLVFSACSHGEPRKAPVSPPPPPPALSTSCTASLPPLPTVPSDALDVTTFGARPDDAVDDTAAIRSALKALEPGGWLVFPPGRYLHKESLSVDVPGAVLWGQGATLHASNPSEQAIFLQADGASIYRFTLTAATTERMMHPTSARLGIFADDGGMSPVRGNVIRGNTIVAADPTVAALSNSTSGAGIFVFGASDFLLAENRVERSLADGIHITEGSSGGVVVGNTVRQSGDDMIGMVSYCDRLSDAVQDPARLDALIQRVLVHDLVVAENDLADQYWGRGVAVVGGRSITIENNKVERTPYAAGVLVAREDVFHTCGSDNVVIRDNVIAAVQTEPPTYSPKSEKDARKTGHASLEIHVLATPTEQKNGRIRDVIHVGPVLVSHNEVRGVRFNGVRLGDDTGGLLVRDIDVTDNAFWSLGDGLFAAPNGIAYRVTQNRQDGSATPTLGKGVAASATGAGQGCVEAVQRVMEKNASFDG